MSRFKPRENSPLAQVIHEAHSKTVLDSISTDLIDLHRLQTGLESIDTLVVGIDAINNGEHNAETLLDVNRTLHTVSDVFEDETLRPTSEITKNNIDEVSMEGIASTALKAIIKVLKWIITAPVRFIQWLFKKEKVTSAKAKASPKKAEMTADKVIDIIEKAESETTESRDRSGLTYSINNLPENITSFAGAYIHAKLSGEEFRELADKLKEDLAQVREMSRWRSTSDIKRNWDSFSPKTLTESTALVFNFYIGHADNPLFNNYRPQVIYEIAQDEKFITKSLSTNTVTTRQLGDYLKRLGVEAKHTLDTVALLHRIFAEDVTALQKVSKEIIKEIERISDSQSISESLRQYSTVASGVVNNALRNSQKIDTIQKMYEELMFSIIDPEKMPDYVF